MPSRRDAHARKKRLKLLILLVFVLFFGFILYKISRYIPVIFQIATKKEIHLKETKENRVNLLLLGVGGGSHEGPNLTDTIIFVSIDPNMKKTTMVSIPRDLWIPDVHAKINAAYTYGEDKQQGGGLVLAKATVGKLLNQPVDYAFKIDFGGFVKAVDLQGGLDIDVARSFDDYAYPLSGKEDDTCGHSDTEIASMSAQIASGSASERDSFPCRYEHLHFDKGQQHMDGTTALKYVRSRHALGPEGSDFARSQRQQKVISAFKDKVFSLGTLLNPVKVVSLIDTLKSSIDTDIQESEYADFVKLAKEMQHAKIENLSLDEGDSANERYGLLDEPGTLADYGGQWVLIPRAGSGDYAEIQSYVSCRLKNIDCTVGKSGILTPTPTPTPVLSPTGKK